MTSEIKPSVARAEREHNVSVTNSSRGIVHCNTCGKGWAVNTQPGGTMPRRWWACPKGCNR